MLLDKTDKARDALDAGASAGLTLIDRRILILTDGKRSLNQVMAMLGADILPAIDRLLRDGYITQHAPASIRPADGAARTPPLGGAVAGLLRAATEAVQARTEQMRANTPAAASASTPANLASTTIATAPHAIPASAPTRCATTSRRSLAASKMYLLDMLQLQRTADAAESRATIQCATDAARLVDALFHGLRLLVGASTPSYGERILNRLAEILPEEALPRLDAVRAERAGVVPLTVVAA
jgi:hypothetical protein